MIWIPGRPVFEWSFSGHFLGPVFEWSDIWMPGSTRFVLFSNGASLDRFIIKRVISTIFSRLVDHSKTRQKCPVFIMVIRIPDHLKTGQISLVFGSCSNIGPFNNRTQIDHLNTRLIWFSDHYCIWIILYKNFTTLTKSLTYFLVREPLLVLTFLIVLLLESIELSSVKIYGARMRQEIYLYLTITCAVLTQSDNWTSLN
jgi:hypothetical protein